MALVCVTGASGFIGSETVAALLAEGHTVRGTVRDASDPSRYGYLTSLPGAARRLTLHTADLTAPGSFDAAVAGCDVVLHTASPYVLSVRDAQRDLVDPAVAGTREVLRACQRTTTVRRVVLTSSLAAVTDEGRDGYVFSETDWNRSSSLHRNPYYFSKAEAERAAWDFVETQDVGFDLVTVNPSMVVGPARNPALNESNKAIRDIADGRQPAIVDVEFVVVDVRDVAEAHVRAAFRRLAEGRILVAAETRSMAEVAGLLERSFSSTRVPRLKLDNAIGSTLLRTVGWRTLPKGEADFVRHHVGRQLRVDNSKSREVLDLEYRDVDLTILEAVEDMIDAGHVRRVTA